MQKRLRSLLLEEFSPELRLQIELLSRRRDISNAAKHEELIKMVRDSGMNITQLGPGTNRYAFKLNGFVVKAATDHDGKIDNMKEFKMAKRLSPHVARTYEVSENGTLLVAEYVPPFTSFQEMLQHQDQIRAILRKFSSVYLIGDVGIAAKNFTNWGLRTGTNNPVCLDFAYVYDVSSELFICRECHTHSILTPDDNFVELYCSNPACNNKVKFETIRSLIGNDVHRHEIGDLAQEGYRLLQSGVDTELDEGRSNYLANKNPTVTTEDPTEQQEEEIEMSKDSVQKIAKSMAGSPFAPPYIPKVHVRVLPDDPAPVPTPPTVHVRVVEPDPEPIPATPDVTVSVSEPPVSTPVAFSARLKPEDPVPVGPVPAELVTPNMPDDDKQMEVGIYSIGWSQQFPRAVSKFSNMVDTWLRDTSVYDSLKKDLKDKNCMQAAFYRAVQNAIHRSLVTFLGFNITREPNNNGVGEHKVFNPPDVRQMDQFLLPTVRFFYNYWEADVLRNIVDPSLFWSVYSDVYPDNLRIEGGIQYGWIDVFKQRLRTKNPILTESGIETLASIVEHKWCVCGDTVTAIRDKLRAYRQNAGLPEDGLQAYAAGNSFPILTGPAEVWVDFAKPQVLYCAMGSVLWTETFASLGELDAFVDNRLDPEVDLTEQLLNEYYAKRAAAKNDVVSGPSSMGAEEGDGKDGDEEDGERSYGLRVEIYSTSDSDDIVRLHTADEFSDVSIPFYANVDDVDLNREVPDSVADPRNGDWDWLINITPDITFYTQDPCYYMSINDLPNKQDMAKVVILKYDRQDNNYLMGVYFVEGIFEQGDDEDDELNIVTDADRIRKVCRILREDLEYTRLSHYRLNVTNEYNLCSEDDVRDSIRIQPEDPDEGEPEIPAGKSDGEDEDAAADANDGDPVNTVPAVGETAVEEETFDIAESPKDPPEPKTGGKIPVFDRTKE